jgi:predicted nuclease with TOPRIM domain
MAVVLQRLGELEEKVRDALAQLAQARGEREALLAKVASLQNDLRSREQELAALRAERDLRRWEEILPRYAEAQIDLATRVDDLLALGAPDRRLP